MISSTTAFSGLSAADLSKLFGTDAGSASSNSNSTNTTTLSASVGVFVSGASGATNSIQAILAEAEIQKAPTAASGGSGINARVAAAYVAQTGSAGTSANASATGSDTMAAVDALVDQTDGEVYQTLAPYQGWDPQQHVAGASSSSLVIATASGVTAVATGEGGASRWTQRVWRLTPTN